MAVRGSMSELILRVRDLIGDNPANQANRVWTDQQIQDALDRERTDIAVSDFRELAGRYSTPAGIFTWTDYYDPSGWGDWEADATVYSGALVQITPLTSDFLVGHWTFTNQPPPVFVKGQTYDVAGAARAIVLRWYALVATVFDFSVMRGTSFSVSQKREGLQMLADQLATEMRVRSAKLVRRDVSGVI